MTIATVRKEIKNCLKNNEVKKEILSGLERIDQGKLLPRHMKDLNSFETLVEIKFTKTRFIAKPSKQNQPMEIVAIVKRAELEKTLKTFKDIYN